MSTAEEKVRQHIQKMRELRTLLDKKIKEARKEREKHAE